MDNVVFSPRANIRYNPSRDINIRASYSSGFRAPQAFDEDLHIENVGGTVAMIELSKDLKVERSNSFSLSSDIYHRWGALQGNLMLEGFYTKLNDVFVLETLGERDGVLIRERRNGDGARVMGINLEGKLAYLSLIQLQAGLTLQKSEYDTPEIWSDDAEASKKMFRTPDVYGYFTATVTPIKPLSIALSGTYTGKMLIQHAAGSGTPVDIAVTTPDFFDMNFKVGYDFSLGGTSTLQLNAGCQNIFNAFQKDFDQGEERDSGYMYGPTLPRSWFAGVKINF